MYEITISSENMNPCLESLSTELIKAVNVILNPCVPNSQRLEAHKLLDEFRDKSPYCADVGLFLSVHDNSCEVRHFGLQLVEHYIKLRWNDISHNEKCVIKDKVLEILSKDLKLKDNNHVKVAVAKIIVEIIKREWPQQWPTLLDELHQLCIMGDVQTEVVLLIFLRLAEDIVQIQNVPDKRRKEVFKGLCMHLKDLFPFFLNTLSSHYEKYCEYKKSASTHCESMCHCHIVSITLETLGVYFEWIPIAHISENPYLLKHLCHLVDDENLQATAAKCLLSLVERKGKQDDRIPLMKLFEQNQLFKIRSQTSQSSEQFNDFEKYFCRMLVTLGTALANLMGVFKEVQEPQSFPMYLNCLLAYTRHPNLVVSQSIQNLWITYLRDQKFKEISSFNAIIPTLLKYEAEKLFMVGYPSKPSSKASQYSLLEFDSDEDFALAFCKFRSEVMEVIKLISKWHPELAFNHASSGLKALYSGQQHPFLFEVDDSSSLDAHSIWDSSVHFTESVFTTLMRNMDTPNVQKLATEGVELLKMTIAFNCEDLYIMSYSLSCTSALFFFANFSSDLLVPLLKKIFSNLLNQIAIDEKSLPKEVLNLRRHSCSLLIKLATAQPKLLLKEFDFLCHCVIQLMERPEQLSALEKSAILETLMILSNELNDYDRQLKFLKEMLSPTLTTWLSEDMKLILSSPDHFIAFVGLNKSPDESDATSSNRAQILYCVNVIKTCAKRCKIVTDPIDATKGKFIHPLSENLNSILYRNPTSELLVPVLTGIFHLIRNILANYKGRNILQEEHTENIRTLNSLHDPAVQSKIHPGYLGVTDITETDKNLILGIFSHNESTPQPRSSFERIKNFLHSTHESCLHALRDSTENLSIDFYMIPNLSNDFTNCLFYCLQFFPDFKLRSLIPFLKPFFYRCPVNLSGDFVTILSEFCNFMFEKLSSGWQKFRLRYDTSLKYEDQITEIEEILADQVNRLLTREYITFLGALLQGKPMIDSSDTQMDDDSKIQQTSNSNHPKQLSELGVKFFQIEAVRGPIICCVFDGLHWLDTVTNIHCLSLCDLVLKQLLKDNLILHPREANYLLQNALHGLQELGEHDSNQGLLLSFCTHVYEKLRPKFPELRDSLMATINCDSQTLDKMERILFKEGKKPSSEKQKKEAFRNAVKNIIGILHKQINWLQLVKIFVPSENPRSVDFALSQSDPKNIGQYHKRDIIIKNLPPLFIMKKVKKTNLLSDTNEDSGLCKLFALSS